MTFCSTGTISATEIKKDIQEFSAVHMAVSGSIELVRSDRNRVVLRVLEGNPDQLEIGVKKGVLHVRRASERTMRFWKRNLRVEGEIHYVMVDSLSTAGSGSLIASHLRVPKLGLNVKGSGDIDVGEIDARELAIKVDGSGDVVVTQGVFDRVSATIRGSGDIEIGKGSTSRSKINITGSGDYNAANLNSKETEVRIVGSGDAFVNTLETLEASIAGSGDVIYQGSPNVASSINGSGKLFSE